MRILDKNRASYKKTFSDGKECVFCKKEDVLECEKLFGKHWKVLVNRYPYMDGNVMVVPARHIENTQEITSDEWMDFGIVLSKTQEVLGKVFKANSFNIGMNMGPESGASISHLHWQVVPRKFKNITALNTFADLHVISITPEEAKRMIDEAI